MASIQKRNNRYCVVYQYTDTSGKRKQKWETYHTLSEARNRKSEIEYKANRRSLAVPNCRTLSDLLKEYVSLYGREAWSLSSYARCTSLINNYIKPVIGNARLSNIDVRFMDRYYQKLQTYPAVCNPATGKPRSEFVSPSTILKIHQLLRNCFNQAVKWQLIEKNPALYATLPKHKEKKREIWDADTLMKALDCCKDEKLKLAITLTFTGTLRMGELLALTWDCIDISEEAIRSDRAYIYVKKELQRVKRDALNALSGKDVEVVFPATTGKTRTVLVLKSLKTESSTRKVFLPKTVALMLADWKKQQDEVKEMLGDEYQDYGLVLATSLGTPIAEGNLRKAWTKLIRDNDLDPVVFHTLRHTSVTYKLKLNGGDIKSVQGDSGHSQVDMVMEVYSHIIDEDRRKNAQLFENAFFKNHADNSKQKPDQTLQIPEGVDPELINKVLSNPEMMALLVSMAKTLKD